MEKNIKKILIIFMILIISFGILYFFGKAFKDEKGNYLYIQMKGISDNQSLIGLSKEEIIKILGNPIYEFNDQSGNVYAYNAGTLTQGTFFINTTLILDCAYSAELRIFFDEKDKVEYTRISLIP